MTAVCHCDDCQKQTGTSFSVLIAVPDGTLEFEGTEHMGVFEKIGESGGKVARRFCRQCGSPLFTTADLMPGVTFVKAGTLADRSWLKPTLHFFCDSMQPWVPIPDDAVRQTRNPEG
jgi:hypothetical protein